jgi:hypothetical protein
MYKIISWKKLHRIKKGIFMRKLILLFGLMLMIMAGCDQLNTITPTPPDKLPPVPENCMDLFNQHKKALFAAYSSVSASQMQVATVANKFAQCMEDEGLSKADAKGIIKKNEADTKQEVENDSSPMGMGVQ